MDLREAHRLAVDLMAEHGLEGWQITGTIVQRHRTRYVVRTEAGTLRVPFALVRPVG